MSPYKSPRSERRGGFEDSEAESVQDSDAPTEDKPEEEVVSKGRKGQKGKGGGKGKQKGKGKRGPRPYWKKGRQAQERIKENKRARKVRFRSPTPGGAGGRAAGN